MVCQKRVALDTVFQRLEKVQQNTARMTDFVALVHDFKNDRKALFEKIANQIEQIDNYQKKNKSLDTFFLERNFPFPQIAKIKAIKIVQFFKLPS